MSYIYTNEIQLGDSRNLDATGRLRTSEMTTLIDIKHTFDKLPLIVSEVTGGSATSTWSNSAVNMSISAASDFVVRKSIKSAPYQSGKSQLFEASFSSFNIQPGVIKRVGYYTSTTSTPFNSTFDGFFLESNGTANKITFQIWKNGTNIASVELANWSNEDYDASLINWSLSQLMVVDFQWSGRIRFYMIVDGVARLFVSSVGTGALTSPYMNNPNKPIRYEIRSTTGTTGAFTMISSSVSSEGSPNSFRKTMGVNNFTERTLPVAGTTYPILGVRVGSSFMGVSGRITRLDIMQTTSDDYVISVQRNPTLSGSASWTSVTNTPVQYSQGTGALSVSTPGFVMSNFLGNANAGGAWTHPTGSIGPDTFIFEDADFSLGHAIDGSPEEWWICITSSGTNSKFRCSTNVEYYS